MESRRGHCPAWQQQRPLAAAGSSGPGSAAGTGGSNQRSSSSAPGGFSGNVPRTEGKSRAMDRRGRGSKAVVYLSSHLLAVGDLWPLLLPLSA